MSSDIDAADQASLERGDVYDLAEVASLLEELLDPAELLEVRKKRVARRWPPMLRAYESELRAWLDADPGLSAPQVLKRMMEISPGRFTEKQLRTVQRGIKVCRYALSIWYEELRGIQARLQ